MKKSLLYNILCGVLAVFFSAALVSCGGGGGSSNSLLYTGESTEAEITAANAVDLLTGSYMGGNMSQFPIPLGSVALGSSDVENGPTLLSVTRIMRDAVNRVDLGSPAQDATASGVINSSQTINGTCGGSATVSISYDEVTGEFSGTFSFSAYDECTEVLNGSMQVTGVFEVLPGGEPGEIINMRMTFNAISASGSNPFTIAGEVTISVNAPDETITMNILLQDGLTDKIFWVNNYSITVTQGAGFTDISVSGTFYDPDEGFVTLSTPVLLHILDFDTWPTGGTLEIAGSKGTKARLIANSDGTTFYILVELTGDDLFDDWDSRDFGTLFWTDI